MQRYFTATLSNPGPLPAHSFAPPGTVERAAYRDSVYKDPGSSRAVADGGAEELCWAFARVLGDDGGVGGREPGGLAAL